MFSIIFLGSGEIFHPFVSVVFQKTSGKKSRITEKITGPGNLMLYIPLVTPQLGFGGKLIFHRFSLSLKFVLQTRMVWSHLIFRALFFRLAAPLRTSELLVSGLKVKRYLLTENQLKNYENEHILRWQRIGGVDINQSYQSFSILQTEVINKWFVAFLNKILSLVFRLFCLVS